MVIISNTIRLDIEARREEIEVMKLVGAPDSFIRRPFLYTGFWHGLLGGVLAWILVTAGVHALAGPASMLAKAYGSSFQIAGLPVGDGFSRSEEHTSELQSLMRNSYAVFCLKKKTN